MRLVTTRIVVSIQFTTAQTMEMPTLFGTFTLLMILSLTPAYTKALVMPFLSQFTLINLCL